MTKSQQYFQDMLEYNKEAFDNFKLIHDKYKEDQKKYQNEFNEAGEKILTIIRKYENLLCNASESGKYGKFSSKTADTFWGFIRKAFPKIDFIGTKD
ncbi:MAG: hypothetical protein KGJ07_02950 [Patescibacteria group bacterium]|nr:hypothetical protein [Patescibacteria group bacterium]MDE2590724.1 hypothetical protein [Patescibacteria group bacterium]